MVVVSLTGQYKKKVITILLHEGSSTYQGVLSISTYLSLPLKLIDI